MAFAGVWFKEFGVWVFVETVDVGIAGAGGVSWCVFFGEGEGDILVFAEFFNPIG